MVLDAPGNNFTQTYTDDKVYRLMMPKDRGYFRFKGAAPASYTIDYFFNLLDVSPIMAMIMFSET
jgi:hypothetical protein